MGDSDITPGHEASDALSPLGEAIPWVQSSISALPQITYVKTSSNDTECSDRPVLLAAVIGLLHGVLGLFLCISILTSMTIPFESFLLRKWHRATHR